MPQAPEHLQAEWDEVTAFEQLGKNFTLSRGGIFSPRVGYSPTAQDLRAVDYLFLEWDYGYSKTPLEVPPAPAGSQS